MSFARYLCLHGAGTNAEILRAQLGPLARELSRDRKAEFVFLDGEVDSDPHPDIKDLYEGPFYNWFPWPPQLGQAHYKATTQAAFDLIDEFIEDEGPFDGVIGFSQGATLAYLASMNHQRQNPYDAPLFNRAVFFCGMPPFRTEGDGGIVFDQGSEVLNIPAVHVMGQEDQVLELSLSLTKLTNPALSISILHPKGHEIPKSKNFASQMAKGFSELDRIVAAAGL